MQDDLLKECVRALRALRARKHKELDASVTAELDDVIERLEHCLETASGEVKVGAELRVHTLETLSKCLNAATNLAEVVRKFFDPE
jgi:hypothetical protein